MLLVLFIINFYRMPSGIFMPIDDVIAPCYGTVYDIQDKNGYTTITCFLSPADVHMQYVPVNGTVEESLYDRTGQFHLAYKLGKSSKNEKRIHYIISKYGLVTVKQVAGYLTRRIDSWIEKNQEVKCGQPLGFIHLGSRVDLTLPSKKLKLKISIGDKLQGGKQVIASYN